MLYEKNYWITYYSNYAYDEDFIDGVVAALFTFAIWKNNVPVIGPEDTSIYEIIDDLREQLLPEKET